MPEYSQKSKDNLATCHPDLQELFNEVIKEFDCTVIEGHREPERQRELFHDGLTKILDSKHLRNPSLAVDVVPFPERYSNKFTMCYFAGYVKGIVNKINSERTEINKVRESHNSKPLPLIKLIWGGDFNQDTQIGKEWFDGAHFELIL